MNETDTSNTVDTAEQRVARGLAWLRNEGAALGWDVGRIDMDRMDLMAVDSCVLAQASGTDYGRALTQASGYSRWSMEGLQWATERGFSSTLSGNDWDAVTEAWRSALSPAGV